MEFIFLFLSMSALFSWLLVGCYGCLHEERTALYDIKAAFQTSVLTSWNGSDCCGWERVRCGSTTRRIIHLDLSAARALDDGSSNDTDQESFYLYYTLNATLFLPFQDLRTLNLSGNNINGCVRNGELSKLSLEVLDLSNNVFVGSLPALEEEWSSLKAISLSSNKLNGTIHVQGLCKMKNLQDLDLSQNGLIGVLPPCLANLTSLKFLDVSDNHLQVNFPLTLISNLSSLKYLSLSNNQFAGTFLFASLSNHSDLKLLDFVDPNNNLEVETEFPVARPSFQLEGLILSNCHLNKDSAAIPSFLSTQYALELLDLSNNNLKGYFPNWLFENKTNLDYLSLRNNSLTGPLILPSCPNENASWLDLSRNEFDGELPTNIGIVFPNLVNLKLMGNSFQGIIPSSLGYMRQLQYLDLSNNSLTGRIRDDYLTNLTSLAELRLSNNEFHGTMPSNSNLSSLVSMFFDGNQFTGGIPTSFCNYSMLFNLDISGNQLSGTIPNCLSNLQQLISLSAEGNYLEGQIPDGFCDFLILQFLDLSSNHLSGSIPPCFNLSSLKYLHLNNNGLTGSFPAALYSSPSIITIDIRNNHLSGELPSRSGAPPLENLRVLLLKGNYLEGSIPNLMCHLKNLRILDLSYNNISGRLPSCYSSNMMEGGDGPSDSFEVHDHSYGGESTKNQLLDSFRGLLPKRPVSDDLHFGGVDQEQFATKSRSYSYKGGILNYISGMDLSCNQLEGDIPMEIGSMSSLRALNLSNNCLTGPIPDAFSDLKEIESLDLSHNMLKGPIPRELTHLQFLEVFSVAYNDLSGPTPGREAQFITFDESSYEGNPKLCGPPLEKKCTSSAPAAALPSLSLPDASGGGHGDDDDATDRLIFFGLFALAFITGFWGFMGVLYLKADWRYTLFRATDRYTEPGFTKIYGLLARR